MVTCPLCAHRFIPADGCRSGCPLAGACHLQCCPRCGYQTPDESRSRLARLVRRLFGTPPVPAGAGATTACSLADLPPGAVAEVRRFGPMPAARLMRLASLGIAPGDRIRLVQRRPVPVVRVEETEIALGEDILAEIHVTAPAPAPESARQPA
jgi:Fe2+ transport system protein FeoA